MPELINTCARRLRQCRQDRQWTIEETCRKLTEVNGGEPISPSRYGNWEQGIRMPKPEQILQLAHVFSKPAAWLQGFSDNESVGAISSQYITANLSHISTKSGNLPINQASDATAYNHDFLKQRNLNPNQLLSIRQIDGSMSGTLEEGDEVLLDLSKTSVQGVDLFGIVVNGSIWIRWIKPELDGSFTISANPDRQADERLSAEQFNNLAIIGRVARIAHDR